MFLNVLYKYNNLIKKIYKFKLIKNKREYLVIKN